MTKFHALAPRALNVFLVLATTLFPLKTANVFATGSADDADGTTIPTCKEGYEYVESVGKCYKKCADGWERNPETNRCRKIRVEVTPTPASDSTSTSNPASSTSTSETSSSSSGSAPDSPAVPICKEDYEYVESVGKCYKKCADGWERNPETNRCRKIRVEETSSPSGSTSSGSISPSSTSRPTSSTSSPTAPSSPSTTSPGTSSPSSSDSPGSSSSSSSGTSIPSCKDGYEYVESVGKCYKKCAANQERNPETNRCRKIASESSSSSSASSLNSNSNAAPSTTSSSKASSDPSTSASSTCKDGYEYVASAGKCYKACNSDQIRNPETNRCKKADTASSTSSSDSKLQDASCKDGYEYVESAGKCYKKCAENQERNPDTNRCKKVENNDGADYDIDVPETGDANNNSFVATGTVVILILAGLAFVAFQYRTEIKALFTKYFKKSSK